MKFNPVAVLFAVLSPLRGAATSQLTNRLRSVKTPTAGQSERFHTATFLGDVLAEDEKELTRRLSSQSYSYLFPRDCCGLPAGQREQKLFDIFSTVSTAADILASNSPQNKAFNWILTDDSYCLCPDNTSCELVQRYVLAVYYYSTIGEGWTNNTISTGTTSECFSGADALWLQPVPSCTWCGNNCDDIVHPECVTQIKLDGINQAGVLPFELQNITYLYYLSNQDGNIGSTIPPELGNLQNLSFVDLNFQRIVGSIPESFYQVSSLLSLDLNDNEMTGSISSEICNLQNLFFLQIGNDESGTNNFGGSTIPSCVGFMPNLQVFDISGLGLVGNLPTFTQSSLSFLDVGSNELSGNLDGTTWSVLTSLQTLVLGDNVFSGNIPASIGEMSSLFFADFTENVFIGAMPTEICSIRDTNGATLKFLEADCLEVTCDATCCTFCNN